MKTVAIVLAAGHGKRMHSSLTKVLHPIAGRPLVHYPIEAALTAGADEVIVVVGHERQLVVEYLTEVFDERVRTVVQLEQKGTGHAVAQALPSINPDSQAALLLYGDTPLLRPEDLRSTLDALQRSPSVPLAMLTCTVDAPAGYGRILRDNQNSVVAIREDRDLTHEQRLIQEVNPGIYAARTEFLRETLPKLRTDNAQGEMYLTDVVAFASRQGGVIDILADPTALVGVNDRTQLNDAEQRVLQDIRQRWRRHGVTIREDVRIEADVTLDPDVTIEARTVLRGTTKIARGAVVDVGCVLTNAIIGPDVVLKPYSIITDSEVAQEAQIGPFSHLRPGSLIGERAHVGNFVETKKTTLHKGAKANHLAYLGDGEIGERANVGAGTIFCNYDGFQKHKTTLGKEAFIGSDSQLVAPVTVGDGAYVATGTTVTHDVPANALAISRTRQVNKERYAEKLRARLRAAAEEAKRKV